MTRKPTTAAQYVPDSVALVRATSLYLATKLGDLLEDVVIVGGLVPTLIVPQADLRNDRRPHVGTMDVDLGLAVALLDGRRYHDLCERLQNAGFAPDTNEAGHATSQRWRIESEGRAVTVDFLIPPTRETDRAGRLRNLEQDFAAIITPGLELAFQDRESVPLDGTTIQGEQASRIVWVCGAGAFVVLKALAFDSRGENKDAYDLVYVLQNYGDGAADVFSHLEPLLPDDNVANAMEILERDFTSVDAVGPRRVAEFVGDLDDAAVRADAAAVVRTLLTLCKRSTSE